MNFVCECGFRAELSAEQRQRLAASGGRAKCPKCGKIITPRIPNEMAVEPPQISSAHGNEIEDLLGMTEGTPPNKPSQQSADPVESVVTVSPTKGATIDGGKSRFRMTTKDYFLFGAIGCNLFLSLLAFGFPLSRVEDVLKLQKRVAELETKLDKQSKDNSLSMARAFTSVLEVTDVKMSSLTIQPIGKKPIIELGSSNKGGALIAIKDADGKTRLQLEVDSKGNSVVRHYDRNGVARTISGLLYTDKSPSGLPFFTGLDANGNVEKD